VLAALPVIPFVYLVVIRDGKKNRVLVKSLLPALLLFVPWLARNVLLSGYLLYPLSATAFFHVDWTVPAHVAKLDYIYARYSPTARLPRPAAS